MLSLFHFALRESGFLFLGKSESTGQSGNLFRPLSKKWRLFQRVDSGKTRPMVFPLGQAIGQSADASLVPDGNARKQDHARLVQKALLKRFAPPAVLVGRLDRIQVDLREIARDSVEVVEAEAEAKEQVIRLQLPDKSVPLFVDTTRAVQITTNLLVNAVKFTPKGGTIRVVVEVDGLQAVLQVEDNGMGIAPELMPEIFELFSHEKVPLDRGGLGLGLTLAKRLVKAHGGTIAADSDGEGKGSCFTIRLPLYDSGETLQADAINDPVADKPAVLHRVLVVDDDPDVGESFSALCSSMGHETLYESDPLRVFDRVREFHPTLVLLDIGLPGIDGYVLAKKLRQLPELQGIRMIAISGYGQQGFIDRSREAGFDEYLLKPVSLDKLAAILGR